MPSDTQVLLVLNVEVIRMRPLQCNRRLRGRWRRKQEVGWKGKKNSSRNGMEARDWKANSSKCSGAVTAKMEIRVCVNVSVCECER